jgi:hypothetical protein
VLKELPYVMAQNPKHVRDYLNSNRKFCCVCNPAIMSWSTLNYTVVDSNVPISVHKAGPKTWFHGKNDSFNTVYME